MKNRNYLIRVLEAGKSKVKMLISLVSGKAPVTASRRGMQFLTWHKSGRVRQVRRGPDLPFYNEPTMQ